MSNRKDSPRNRAFKPVASILEGRQLLSGVVSGTDIDGDTWTLQLTGPGTISVVKQNDSTGNPSPLNSATEINTIQMGGTDPLKSKLVGTVIKGANGDGKVFFQSMSQIPNRDRMFSQEGRGLVSIDMPNFWLGSTTAASATVTSSPAATIDLPDGVNTLNFGGVDTTHDRIAGTAGSGAITDADTVSLGLPGYGGTRIIIDKAISSAESVPSTTAGAAASTLQHGVFFAVSGRIDLFQANSIEGNASLPPGQFSAESTAASGPGGTVVFSGTAGQSPYLASDPETKGDVSGAIGNVRVGNDATNFTTIVTDGTNLGNARIANFSIGGETNNVLLVAPNGSRTVSFGKGMDNVEIRTHDIVQLQANRGALNSTVVSDLQINGVNLGGDVVNTKLLAGVHQNFSNIYNQASGVSSGSTSTPEVSTDATGSGGHISVRVAGDVTNSIFAAAVVPFNGTYGDPNQIVIPGGQIKGKIQGTVNNSAIAPNTPNIAFYAHKVTTLAGPVTPPNVPQAPYLVQQPNRLPGIPHPHASETLAVAGRRIRHDNAVDAASTIGANSTVTAASVPQGPRARRRS